MKSSRKPRTDVNTSRVHLERVLSQKYQSSRSRRYLSVRDWQVRKEVL